MALDPKSEEGLALRKLFPLLTMPAQQFKELCVTCNVTEIPKGSVLFNIGEEPESFIYLLKGAVVLEGGELIFETIRAGTDAAKFALAHQFPRKVSACALTQVSYIGLGLNVFDKTDIIYNEMENVYMVKNDEDSVADASVDWLTAMLQSPIFQRLPAVNLQQVLMSLQEVKFAQGDVIFRQGGSGDYCYFIRQGRCTLSRKASERAKEISYLELSEGETFGEQAIILGEQRNMTVTATTDLFLSRLDAKSFIKFIKEQVVNYIEYPDLEKERQQDTKLLVLDIRSVDEYNKYHSMS